MLSIIVCSKNKTPNQDFVNNIAKTIGLEYELLHIDNSEEQHSIFSAYNEGILRSKYNKLCFLHEDVCFHSNGWGQKIEEHLQASGTGILGLAGRDFTPKVPAAWRKKLSGANIIQSDKSGVRRTRRRMIPTNYQQALREVITLDGVMLCARKELFEKISFDESLSGFHGYDFDICIQAAVIGYRNFVMYDIVLEHFSRGNPNACYYRALIKVFRKWKHKLPLYINHSTEQVENFSFRDFWGLSKLLAKMVRRQMPVNEIQKEIYYFTDTLNLKLPQIRKMCVLPEIYLMKCLHLPLLFSKRKYKNCGK
ncbi:MAG: hypothetical protein JXR27_06160 [Paludibacteraceae bacterium]|nr:hypothetical protein [Paludibacteraceae bacterium]